MVKIDPDMISGGANIVSGGADIISNIIKSILSTENIYFFILMGAITYGAFWFFMYRKKHQSDLLNSYIRRRRDI